MKTGRIKEIMERAGLTAAADAVAISPDDRATYFGINRTETDIWMVTLEEGGKR